MKLFLLLCSLWSVQAIQVLIGFKAPTACHLTNLYQKFGHMTCSGVPLKVSQLLFLGLDGSTRDLLNPLSFFDIFKGYFVFVDVADVLLCRVVTRLKFERSVDLVESCGSLNLNEIFKSTVMKC